MKRSIVVTGLVAAVALQFFVLSGMVIRAALPRWTGTEVRVETIPVDPRSMFRGNYARLNYSFSMLPTEALGDAAGLRVGEIVYVSLQPGGDGLYVMAGASLDRPTDGVFLRGRLLGIQAPFPVRYGIEAFFAPKEKALRLERELRDGGVAVLMVAGNGRVALKDVSGRAPEG